MAKKLSTDDIEKLIAEASAYKTTLDAMVGQQEGDDPVEVDIIWGGPPSPQERAFLANFEPPQSLSAWISATDVEGHLSNRFFSTVKDRGATLQRVDAAYATWIQHRHIKHHGNSENLFTALETYRGYAHKLGQASADGLLSVSKDYRDERNKNGVMDDVHRTVRFIAKYGKARAYDAARAQKVRRRVLTLFGNIEVKHQYAGDVMGALGVVGAGLAVANLKDDAEDILNVVKVSLAGAATLVYVGVKTKENKSAGKSAMEALKETLSEIWEKFIRWAAEKIKELRGGDIGELLGLVGAILNQVFEKVLKKAAPFVGGATDIAKGVQSLVQDAWTRTTISAQKTALVTADGAFAIIRAGIEHGIALRQAVAGWSMAKGVVSIAVSATTGAGAIADLVLSGLEFGFKLAWNWVEEREVSKVLFEAKLMHSYTVTSVISASTGVAMPISSALLLAPEEPEAPPDINWTSMPPFKAANYTIDQFLDNKYGAYLNFLDSLVKASPIMAAVAMNAGVVRNSLDVFHSATPRSTDDVLAAKQNIVTLKGEAEKLYSASSFKVKPNLSAVLTAEDDKWYQSMLTKALAG